MASSAPRREESEAGGGGGAQAFSRPRALRPLGSLPGLTHAHRQVFTLCLLLCLCHPLGHPLLPPGPALAGGVRCMPGVTMGVRGRDREKNDRHSGMRKRGRSGPSHPRLLVSVTKPDVAPAGVVSPQVSSG